MATRDWASLGWTPTLSFALPTERQLAQSSIPDSGKGAEFKFNPTAMNAQLLASLGYTGTGLGSSTPNEFGDTGPQWSDDARTWLANNGYTVGVAHDPNTSPGGRPEYYGLVDPNGNFVSGQDDPTMTMSDTLMEQITPFLMMAGPFLNATGVIGAAAPGAAGTVGAASAPASITGDLISSAINGFGGGVGSAGIGSVGSALAPLASAGAGLAGLNGMTTGDISNAISQGFGQGASNAVGNAVGSTVSNAVGLAPLVPNINLPDIPELSPPFDPTKANQVLNQTLTPVGSVPTLTPPQGSWLDNMLDPIKNVVKPITDAVGGGSNLAALVGAGLGAASGGGSTTSSRDPWLAAQPYLKNILGDLEAQRAKLAANPFTPQQQQAYSNAYAGLDQSRAAVPGLLNWSQGAMQRQSTVPSYQQLFGGGLLNAPAAPTPMGPTAQAGGAGGLLGDNDRMKALMARGQGLIG